ncbi:MULTISPECIES: glycosyltransferase family 4 protein [unclassified Flavobacterium]|jgi:glycosyltransferase involved in cell wall biosynthesis|uniref:glycosyltransferase family 4 protein n=1 Tax=unclassified Flavobacterium TaxID=196869 RepID=UPI0025BBABE2|nr:MULTISPECIES: glycosyltransferase family 4 protein [unclassified Flavobacterium]
MKILFLTKYNSDGASSRYRTYNYKPYFDKKEIQYYFKPLLDSDYVLDLYNKKKIKTLIQSVFSVLRRIVFLLFNSKQYNLIIIEKELFPNLPYFIESFFLKSKLYALDFDDYIATQYKENKNKRFFLKNKIDKLVSGAKFVTVGNHWYFEEFKSNNLIFLPTVINLEDYPNVKQNYLTKVVTIVWIGSPTTVKYLQIVVPALQCLAKKYAIKLKVIGAAIAIEGVDVEIVDWSAQTEAKELLSSDIGIMPLRDTLWEKGKCGFKLIQYMACGLPVVASRTPANEEIVKNGVNGLIVYNENDWYTKLEELILNESLRERFGKSGRNRIESDYSYQVWGNRYVNMINNA